MHRRLRSTSLSRAFAPFPFLACVALTGCGLFGGNSEPTTPQQELIEEGVIDEELIAFVEERYGCGFEPVLRDSEEPVRYGMAIDGRVCGQRRRFVKLEAHGWVDVTPIDPVEATPEGDPSESAAPDETVAANGDPGGRVLDAEVLEEAAPPSEESAP